MMKSRNQSIVLVFRGFTANPEEVQTHIGVKASRFVQKDAPQPNVAPYRRSAVVFEVDFPKGCMFFEMFPALMAHLKGVDNICRVRDIIKPEFLEIDITLPIKDLGSLRGRSFDAETIANMHKLGATLSFSFL